MGTRRKSRTKVAANAEEAKRSAADLTLSAPDKVDRNGALSEHVWRYGKGKAAYFLQLNVETKLGHKHLWSSGYDVSLTR